MRNRGYLVYLIRIKYLQLIFMLRIDNSLITKELSIISVITTSRIPAYKYVLI